MFFEYVISLLNHLFVTYAVGITGIYFILAVISLFEILSYRDTKKYTNYKELLSSPFAPTISLIAPAYNEGLSIVENIRSLLSIQYNAYEVIIVNDGSSDDSIEKMKANFSLEKVPFFVEEKIKTQKIKAIYKSTNKALHRLLVIDKENGGKADALNAGLNVSNKELVTCIDVDCIIEPEALLKLVKPFVSDDKSEVIACGGVIRVANDCVIQDGRLLGVRFPKSSLARFQVLEYLRAFLLGRMAWAKLNGLILISGALGMFDRKIAVAAGGYNTNTVGEDMELIVRMRAYMAERNKNYKVAYIPDPLCWTEVPETHQVLGNQRNRWTRGTIEVLKLHKGLFFNLKYGVMGLLSYPFWFFFEWLAPIIETLGLVYFFILIALGHVFWLKAIALILVAYTLSVLLSISALLAEELSFAKYVKKSDINSMFLAAILEPILYHPKVVYWALKGNYDLLMGKKSWGKMVRTGFKKAQA
ncbi:MAG: glycosyltransferase [Reichenbachiella sp.]|uniref:glycosyltransferase family 2 protein n=3 Tax=Reichenbachiella sp. TaxID=2184521 RepID=UPI003264E1DF